MKDVLPKFVFAKVMYKRGSDETKKYNVVKPLTFILPDGEKADELSRLEGKKSVKELKALFEKHAAKG